MAYGGGMTKTTAAMQATYTKNGRTFLLDYDQASLEADTLAAATVALSGAPMTIDWAPAWLSVHFESFDTSVAEREWLAGEHPAQLVACHVALMGGIPMVGAPIESLAQVGAVDDAVNF